ncbi:MAG: DNA translocase FtsK [Planctomycetota bacterium]
MSEQNENRAVNQPAQDNGINAKRCLIAGIGLTIFGALSTISVMSHSIYDLRFMSALHQGYENRLGFFGAKLADHFLGLYGILGFVIPLLLAFWGIALIRSRSLLKNIFDVVGVVVLLGAFSVFFGQIGRGAVGALGVELPAGPGGVIGGALAGNFIRDALGSFGLMLVVWTMSLVGVILIARSRTETLLKTLGHKTAKTIDWAFRRTAEKMPVFAGVSTPGLLAPEPSVLVNPADDSSKTKTMPPIIVRNATNADNDMAPPSEIDKSRYSETQEDDFDFKDVEIQCGDEPIDEDPWYRAPEPPAAVDAGSDNLGDDESITEGTTVDMSVSDESSLSEDDVEMIEPTDEAVERDEPASEPEAITETNEVQTLSNASSLNAADSASMSAALSAAMTAAADQFAAVEEGIENVDESDIEIDDEYEDEKPSQRAAEIVNTPVIKRKKKKRVAELSISADEYRLPDITVLEDRRNQAKGAVAKRDLQMNGMTLINTLHSFKVKAQLDRIQNGPTITTYEIKLAPGTNVQKIHAIDKNLALCMNVEKVRITDPIAGRGTIGIEVPKLDPTVVGLREIIETKDFQKACEKMDLPVVVGRDTKGLPLILDLHKAPHMLVAGATGTGKSVAINAIISSILLTQTPHKTKLILIDPKQVEFRVFGNNNKAIPHLLAPVVTDMEKAGKVMQWAVDKMELRYDMLASVGARTIGEYNLMNNEEKIKRFERYAATDSKLNKDDLMTFMPFIVLIVDEWADLMMTHREEAELAASRLAQKARAVGIHLILATQQPTAQVVTSIIKANIPTRIACKTNSNVASRVILDRTGAELLVGKGDMLVMDAKGRCIRAQGAFIDTPEVEALTDSVMNQTQPVYDDTCGRENIDTDEIDLKGEDPNTFIEAADCVIYERPSTSYMQRKLKIGYNRAGRITDIMIEMKLVKQNGSKGLDVIVKPDVWERIKAYIRGEVTEEDINGDDCEDEADDVVESGRLPVVAAKPVSNAEPIENDASDDDESEYDDDDDDDETGSELEDESDEEESDDESDDEETDDESLIEDKIISDESNEIIINVETIDDEITVSPSVKLLNELDEDFDEEFADDDDDDDDDVSDDLLNDEFADDNDEDDDSAEKKPSADDTVIINDSPLKKRSKKNKKLGSKNTKDRKISASSDALDVVDEDYGTLGSEWDE